MYRTATLSLLLSLILLLGACTAKDGPGNDGTATGEQIDYRDTGANRVMNAYEESMVEAVNKNRFSLVEGLLDPNGPLYKQQESLVQRLSAKNIKEKLIRYQIMNIQKIGGEYKFYIIEKIGIYYPDGRSAVNEYKWIYTVTENKETNAFKVYSIERWE
ncbi:TcaA NTF2-like domain-containing protein [Paenibacillus montanisoli]|uniref:TcaA protein NTF2-like domain-containing protein n=1 Tax=Paenibacillus montanisoli TaxID=2081970 RepID=A0A328U7D4_9BACL|nr:hypothetical protein [Paenibacillus montanisoli]RAP77992.1 hypothetical protein DL346_05955 [Paenibacillus montanisoli]